jgi:hypothetical protein
MAVGDSLDNLIRMTLHEQVSQAEPPVSVRDSLLKEAARSKIAATTLGPSIPALVDDLREAAQERRPEGRYVGSQLFSGQIISGHWLMLMAPVYAIR